MISLPEVNLWAVLVSAIVYFGVGFLWYSPWLFGKVWMKAHNIREEDMKECNCIVPLIGAFAIGLILSYILALFIGWADVTTAKDGAIVGFLAWLGFIATTHFSGVLWEKKPLNLYLLHMGCLFVAFLAIGAILGAWL